MGASLRASGIGTWILRALGYAGAAALLTWPLPIQIASHLGTIEAPGDPYLNLWALGWNLHVLTTNPSALVDGRIFDANIYYPASQTLAYSDHLILQSLFVLPVYLVTGDAVVCYNVLLLGSLMASGLAMHAYARAVSGSDLGGWIAGLAWASWPFRIARLLHIQLQALYFLPLALLFLHRTLAGRRRRDVIGLGIFAGLQAVSALNYGLITGVALAIVAVTLAIGIGRWRSLRVASRLVAAAVLGALVVAPFAWPYWRLQQREGFTRTLYDASRHAAVPGSYLQVTDRNWLYGRTRLLTARDASGHLRAGRVESVEHVLFPGVTLTILAAAGVWWGRRHGNRPVVWAMVAMATTGFVFSLGPEGVRWLYATAYHYVFGFHSLRAPSRFGVLVTCALAVLASLGVAAMAQRHPRRGRVLAGGAIALMLLEYISVPLPFVVRPPQRTLVGEWLARAPGAGAVIHLPLALDARNSPPMVQSMEHWRPIVNGHSGQRPSFFTALADLMNDFPTAEALWSLRDFEVRFVVSPKVLTDLPPTTDTPALPLADSPLVERARFPEGVIYELVWTPEREARLPRPAPPPPPSPGPPPFAVGESATYDVRWVGGALGMSAGRATLEVRPGPGGRGYRFVARGETAHWVRQFFDARNEYATVSSPDLMPLEHRREEHQGRRDLTRVFTFDHAARTVNVTSGNTGDEGVAFSVPPGTRDALTALYYARSVRLNMGETVRVPVNDGGRNLILELRAVATESITVEGRAMPVVRLEPRIVQRVVRRRPLEMTVWLSHDSRRIPVRADVSAGFGQLRLDLLSYRPR